MPEKTNTGTGGRATPGRAARTPGRPPNTTGSREAGKTAPAPFPRPDDPDDPGRPHPPRPSTAIHRNRHHHTGSHHDREQVMPQHTQDWQVRLHLFEEEGTTKAHAVLDLGGTAVTGQGVARRNPRDRDIPEIGDELAAGRAMNDLAQKLLTIAQTDIEGMSHPGP